MATGALAEPRTGVTELIRRGPEPDSVALPLFWVSKNAKYPATKAQRRSLTAEGGLLPERWDFCRRHERDLDRLDDNGILSCSGSEHQLRARLFLGCHRWFESGNYSWHHSRLPRNGLHAHPLG